jgi:hypothetical protein
MKRNIAKLEGEALDAAVIKAAGWFVRDGLVHLNDGSSIAYRIEHYAPSWIWEHGGPFIERERMWLTPIPGGTWTADIPGEPGDPNNPPIDGIMGPGCVKGTGHGPTPLIAAMRAFVASKLAARDP